MVVPTIPLVNHQRLDDVPYRLGCRLPKAARTIAGPPYLPSKSIGEPFPNLLIVSLDRPIRIIRTAASYLHQLCRSLEGEKSFVAIPDEPKTFHCPKSTGFHPVLVDKFSPSPR